MLHDSPGFSGFSVNDLDKAKQFYGETLGFQVDADKMGLHIHFTTGAEVFVYAKEDHKPASFTILNFPVDNIDETVDGLTAKGVSFERYELGFASQDGKGILRGKAAGMGPDIAWFKDPAGNVLSVLEG